MEYGPVITIAIFVCLFLWFAFKRASFLEQTRNRAMNGDPEAQCLLGVMYAKGRGIARNEAEAVKWFRMAAAQNFSEGQCLLGIMYRTGRGTPKNEAEALKLYRRAAEQNNAGAQAILGHMYATGTGAVKDDVEAHAWLTLAEAHGNQSGHEELLTIEQRMTSEQKARAALLKGVLEAKVAGTMLGTDPNDKIAALQVELKKVEAQPAAKLANHLTLGAQYENGEGVLVGEAEIAEQNNPTAILEAEGYTPDQVQLRKDGEQGDAAAQYSLGLNYCVGINVPKDDAEAVKWFKRAAEQNHVKAQYELAGMYEHGFGVAENKKEAAKWYLAAANQHHSEAQAQLGHMYACGIGVRKNDAEAVNWYRKAAEQGCDSSQCSLGSMYADGRGVRKDETEAFKWYQEAATTGNPLAQRKLGEMYFDGCGIPKNEKRAFDWWFLAAEQNDEEAQHHLRCYVSEMAEKIFL
jgi:TPR repeat protein